MHQPTNDELFKEYLQHVHLFSYEKLIQQCSKQYEEKLLHEILNKEINEQLMVHLLQLTHASAIASSISIFENLIADYSTWLTANYSITPLPYED